MIFLSLKIKAKQTFYLNYAHNNCIYTKNETKTNNYIQQTLINE